MPRYRIHRMKDAPRENFRWSAHTGGLAILKPKDYDFSGDVEASTPYNAWKMLAEQGNTLRPGDVLETSADAVRSGELQIAKYIGFEPAKWYVPEPPPRPLEIPGETPDPANSHSNSHPL